MNKTTFIRFYTVMAIVLCLSLAGCTSNPPGTLPDPADLPKADTSKIGKSQEVSFAMWIEEINDMVPFIYVYDHNTDSGHLAVSQIPALMWPSSSVPPVGAAPSVSVLTVYAPSWKGLDGLLASFDKSFIAKIENVTYISYQEGISLQGVTINHTHLDPAEIINPLESAPEYIHNAKTEIYVGMVSQKTPSDPTGWVKLDSGIYVYLTANLAETDSQGFTTNLYLFQRTLQRFSLEQIMGLT